VGQSVAANSGGMWRRHVPAAMLQLRFSSSEILPNPFTITPHVVETITSPGNRLTRLPEDIITALQVITADVVGKNVRERGARLTDELKKLSRSRHRGGNHPNLHRDDASHPAWNGKRPVRGNVRQLERRALAALSQHAQHVHVEGEHPPSLQSCNDSSDAQLSLLQSTRALAKHEAAAAARLSLYEKGNALSYAGLNRLGPARLR